MIPFQPSRLKTNIVANLGLKLPIYKATLKCALKFFNINYITNIYDITGHADVDVGHLI